MRVARITEYTIGEDADPNRVVVAYRGYGLWAVACGGRVLNGSGGWDFEPVPSSRTPEWLSAHRFGRREALRLAHEVYGS